MDAKRLSLTLFIIGVLSISGRSQQSSPTYVFQLTAEQAEQIYRGSFEHIQPETVGMLIDSFILPEEEQVRTPGHYLYVQPQLENLALQIKSYHSFQVNLRNNNRDLALEITDRDGRTPEDALVYLEKRQIPYHSGTGTYRLKNRLKGGFLRVTLDDEVMYLEVDEEEVKPLLFRRFKYWRSGPLGYWLTTPIRWGENTYQYFRRGFGWGDWHWYNNPFRFLKGKGSFRGYIAMNQPKYRTGDTLQIKAYLTNRKAKPWKRPVRLRIGGYSSFHGRYIRVIDTLLESETAGHFNYRQVLADSLPLDMRFQINLEHKRKDNFGPLVHSFRLEDYELDEAEFSLTMQQEAFHRGEQIRFKAAGKDQNDQYVADAEVHLLLLTKSIDAVYQDSLSIPDTLWSSRETLRNREDTPLSIPDSIFPPADLQLNLQANFVHPSGEMHQKEADFSFFHHWDELILKLDGGKMIMDYQKNGQSQPRTAYLRRYQRAAGQVRPSVDTIQLPYEEDVRPHLSAYELRTDDHYRKIDLAYEYDSQVSVSGTWEPGKVNISIQNPRRLPITYMLQNRTKAITRAMMNDDYLALSIPVTDQAQWKLSYEYYWNGPVSKETYIYRLDQQLQVDIEQPARVSPGESVPVKITVKDAYGKPAPSVQLTAAAVNSQFGQTKDAYRAPDISYKRKRGPFVLQNFQLDRFEWKDQDQHEMNAAWCRKFGVWNESFYAMRYQNDGVWTRRDTLARDSFYAGVAQISPFLIQKGKALSIYMIYLNQQLVYYHGVSDQPAYSFVGRPGYNHLSLRTREAEYELDSVWLEAGQKLELAINLDRFPLNIRQQGMYLIRQSKPEFLTYAEKQLLRKTMLALRSEQRGTHYFWDQPDNIHLITLTSYGRNITLENIVGPFPPDRLLHHVRRDDWERTFTFEPGFIYDIAKTRERLYEWDRWTGNERVNLPKYLPPKQPGQLILRPADIVREILKANKIFFDNLPAKRISGRARLQLFNLLPGEDSLRILAQVLVSEKGTEQVLQPDKMLLGDLSVGKYRLILARADGWVSVQEFSLSPDQTLALDLSNVAFVQDSLRTWPDRLYSYSLNRRRYRDHEDTPRSTANPYTGRGRLIRGQITDENGEPLIGASVLAKGTTSGAVTDFDGYYEIWVPEGAEDLVVSYTGFSTYELGLDDANGSGVSLESAAVLSEVVVTGLGVQHKKEGYSVVSSALQGVAPGVEITTASGEVIRIRGSRTIGGLEPLFFIDGKPVSVTEVNKIPPEMIGEVQVVKDSTARALYGAQAAGGVIIIKLRDDGLPAMPVPESFDEANSLRNDFRDHAFWEPKLVTDERGEAYFQASYPDNITAWDTYVLGMDRRRRAGIGLARTQAWKSLVARLSLPRFLIAGDEVDITGQTVNYGNDSLKVRTFFREGGKELSGREHMLGASLVENYRLSAPSDIDSLKITYGLTQGDYQDGEEREVRIFPPGSLETEGYFMVLNSDTTLDLQFDRSEPITLFAADNALELLLQDLEYLRAYPHDCMEQTASRLSALCLEKMVRKQLGQSFDGERDIRKMVERLEKTQRPDGAWGWWPGNEGNYWITVHVLQALHLADRDAQADQFAKGVRYLVSELPRMETQQQLQVLDFLSSHRHQLDYDRYLSAQDSLDLSLHDRLLTQLIRQRMGSDVNLDTLNKYRQQTLYGAYFWGDAQAYAGPGNAYRDVVNTSLVAYEMLKLAGKREEAGRVRQYFLERRGIGRENASPGWYNTYETARVLAAIIPDMISAEGDLAANHLTLSTSGVNKAVDKFPFRMEEIAADHLRIEKSGTTPLYFTAYQQYHKRNPEPKTNIFRINSRMIQKELEVNTLEQGLLATLEVDVEIDADAEYIMLEIPIPAGCSFADRTESRNQWEVHREYQREKVAIFCSRLSTGKHTFTVQLEPRFTGAFTLNPARAEQMYFPVLFGRNELKRVEVE
ncbi:MAG: alpha-2-macroglobulin family protein [Saprospiraceae bacterium]|nr:carboxypeptidase-like regulatory domain-containing protein [Lewinella sp.]